MEQRNTQVIYGRTLMLNEFDIDKKKIALSFSKAATSYDAYSGLQKMVADKLLKKLSPGGNKISVLDLGCGTGYCLRGLKELYPQMELYALDLAAGMLTKAKSKTSSLQAVNFVCGDGESLPFVDESFDLIISSLVIQWCSDLEAVFCEIKRVLSPGGECFIGTFAPKTLYELKSAWSKVDNCVHVNQFVPAGELEKAIKLQDFGVFNIEQKNTVLYYDKLQELTRELKAVGAHNMNKGQVRGLMGKKAIEKFNLGYEAFRNAKGKLPATYEIYYIQLSA